jgi:hypothetical protein
MQSKQLTWRFAWDYPAFRVKVLLGVFVSGLIVFYLPAFFAVMQTRNGTLINDFVLARLPARDMTLYIFLILYPASAFFFWRMGSNSTIFITALWGYLFMCLLRMLMILLIPLEAPVDLVHMSDPFSNFFYGPNRITKDLFFSGHTATLFLVGLCLENKREKYIVFAATAVLALLLLIQHVHYTADVIAAPFFSYLAWYMGKTIARI